MVIGDYKENITMKANKLYVKIAWVIVFLSVMLLTLSYINGSRGIGIVIGISLVEILVIVTTTVLYLKNNANKLTRSTSCVLFFVALMSAFLTGQMELYALVLPFVAMYTIYADSKFTLKLIIASFIGEVVKA